MIFLGQICPKMVFPVQKRRSKHHHCLLRIRFSLDTNFQLKLTILIFSNKFAQKGYFQSKTKKLNITVGFCVFEISQDTNFNLNKQFWILRYFWSKTEESEHHHWILHIWTSTVTKYQLHWQFRFFNLP